MAEKAKKVPVRRRRRDSKSTPLAALQEALAIELFTCLHLALARFGWQKPTIARAMRRSLKLRRAPKVSGPYLAERKALAAALDAWSRNQEFLDPRGKPRVLPIVGAQGSFERLARRFLPHLSVHEVLKLACDNAEVVRRPGGRVALLGSVLVKVLASDEAMVAHVARQFDALLSTALHNRSQRGRRQPRGRMERAAYGVIPRKAFEGLMKEFRPQIYDLLVRFDAAVERQSAHSSRGSTAVGMSVHVSEEPDLERAGLNFIAAR